MIRTPKATLTEQEWRLVGDYANKLIQNDMKEGKFQNDQSGLQYKSKEYKKLKANGMRRLTKDKIKTYSGIEYIGKQKLKAGKKGFTSGKRVAGYYSAQIDSTNTAFVDMTLTGRLKKSLHVVKNIPNGVVCGYSPGDNAAGKIAGNLKYGRQILGLSTENIKKVGQYIQELLSKRNISEVINIEVRF